LHEAFSEYGEIKNIYMNLDRQTGFVKGYALIEYKTKREAQSAIDAMNGAELLTQNVVVDYAFKVSVDMAVGDYLRSNYSHVYIHYDRCFQPHHCHDNNSVCFQPKVKPKPPKPRIRVKCCSRIV